MAKGRSILVVSHFGGVGELCKRFLGEGNRVRYCIKDKPSQDINDGLIQKVKRWEPYVAESDLIVFDDTNFGKVADELRAQGKAVVGPCPYSDKLEMDRGFGSEEMEKAGMTVIPDWNFTSFDEAIAFVKQNPGRYVAKPSGKAQDEKALTYVGKQEDGSDVLAILENYKKKWGHKIHEIQLQQFVKGVEIACGGFFNGKEFIQPIFINTEYKKFMNDDLGPNCGESGTTAYWQRGGRLYHETLEKMAAPLRAAGYSGYFDINLICTKEAAYPLEFTCFDAETEILTDRGWLSYQDVKAGDKAFSINPKNRRMEWKFITHKAIRDYDGDMVQFGHPDRVHTGLSAVVTPEHKMLVTGRNGESRLVRADSIPHGNKIIRYGVWDSGEDVEWVEIPEYIESHHTGRHHGMAKVVHPAYKVPAEAFMGFLGLLLSEGSSRHYGVQIAQSANSRHRPEIEKILNDTGMPYRVQESGDYQIDSVQVTNMLLEYGILGDKCYNKKIPYRFKNMSPRLLEKLLRGYLIGDGNTHIRTGQPVIFTTSDSLAGDLQEILLKCGTVANIHVQKTTGTEMAVSGKVYTRKHDMHYLAYRKINRDTYVDGRMQAVVPYKGEVWDVEVEDWHTLLVRRHGKAYFSGNCRFGFPTVWLQMEGIKSNLGDFFDALGNGNKFNLQVESGFQMCVVCTVAPYPFEDPEGFKKYAEGRKLEFKDPTLSGIYLSDVKLVGNEWVLAGNSGYAAICVGLGQTMEEAKENVYERVKSVSIPDMAYRTDIGFKWNNDRDKLQAWGWI